MDNKETKKSEKSEAPIDEKVIENVEVEVEEVEPQEEIRHLPYYDKNSITALILSIFAILSPFMVFGFGGILGIILGIIALYNVRQSRKQFENDMNHTAKLLAVIGIAISGVSVIISVFFLASFAWRINALSGPSFFHMNPRVTYFHRF